MHTHLHKLHTNPRVCLHACVRGLSMQKLHHKTTSRRVICTRHTRSHVTHHATKFPHFTALASNPDIMTAGDTHCLCIQSLRTRYSQLAARLSSDFHYTTYSNEGINHFILWIFPPFHCLVIRMRLA